MGHARAKPAPIGGRTPAALTSAFRIGSYEPQSGYSEGCYVVVPAAQYGWESFLGINMGLSVRCACGNSLEGENLDLVVTMSCPHCRRELTLELDDATGASRRPVLTVLQGPHWIGEQFVVPVGVDLSIGRGDSNWIVLEDDSISETHCRIRLLPDGGLILEDQKSAAGTWVGPKRVARGKLISAQPFRLGNFEFRMDLRQLDATPSPATVVLHDDEPTVRFNVVKPEPALFKWLIRNRFQISRTFMWAGAWMMGTYHALAWRSPSSDMSRWLWPVVGAGLIILAMLAAGSRVSLIHRQFKYASFAVLAVLVGIDLGFMFPGPAIASLCIAASLTILVMRVPTGLLASLSFAVGLTGLLVLFGATVQRVIGQFG